MGEGKQPYRKKPSDKTGRDGKRDEPNIKPSRKGMEKRRTRRGVEKKRLE